MRLEILLTAVLFFGGTFLSGYVLRRVLKLKEEGILFSVLSGTMLWWAVLELILVPIMLVWCAVWVLSDGPTTMEPTSFTGLVYGYNIVLLLIAIAGCFSWKEVRTDIGRLIKDIQGYLTIGHLVALVLICYQLYFIHHHMYLEWDDTYYVNLANVAVNSDKIYWIYPETGTFVDFDKRYILSLWPIFYAWLSRFTGVVPTIMAHTVLPWLMIPLAYMVYILIGKELFPEDKQLQGMFLSFVILLHLFMSGEHTAGLTFLSITPWVGKGVLATVLIPSLFYCVLRLIKKDITGNWFLLGIVALAGCLLSSMGIMLTPVFIGMSVLILALQKKNIQYLIKGIAACSPCIVLGLLYILLAR